MLDSTYFTDKDILKLTGDWNLYSFGKLSKILQKNKTIKKIFVEAEVDINIVYLLMKFEQSGLEVEGIDLSNPKYDKIRNIDFDQRSVYRDKSYSFVANLDIFLPPIGGNKFKAKFWLKTFVDFIYIFVIENCFLVFAVFLLFGLALMYFIFIKLTSYNAQYDAVRVIHMGVMKLIGPFLISLFMVAKLSTSACALIKLKNINQEFRSISVMNLNPKSSYLNSIVCAYGIAGIFLNLIATISTFIGASIGWWIVAYRRPESFFREASALFKIKDVLISTLITSLAGIVCGFIACVTGLDKNKSVESVINSMNDCIFWGVMSIAIIQALVPIMFGNSFVE